ncbi:MAG TPA: leucyl aminopeptidase [Rhodospirillaceae bacterium]|nr:leucyl aminopeptidase [Rhodospirillaceae bacterium]
MGVRPGPRLQPQAALRQPLVRRLLAARHGFKGEAEDVLPVLTPEGWLVLVGLDDETKGEDARRWRRIGGALVAELADCGFTRLDIALDLDPLATAELAFGMMLRAWRPAASYRSKPDEDDETTLVEVVLVTGDPDRARTAFQRLAGLAAGSALARDLVVAPANLLTPSSFIDRLSPLVALGVTVEVIDPVKAGLGLLAAVGQGSAHAPRLAVLRWSGGEAAAAPAVFVGKGITFDSGGIDIKDDEDLDGMKGDMAGAAAVVGALYAVAARRAAVNVVGVLALAENMPSGRASRPGDVVRGFSGLSVEIIDTDAEGRLVLADALAWAAARCRPRLMVDLATLTGAVEVALGHHRAGLFTGDDALAGWLMAAGDAEDELLWRLPLTEVYDDALKSAVADLRNCQWESGPDHLHASRFLQNFVPGGVAWAHLDIAGVTEAEEDGPLAGKGPTGFGVRLLDRLVADRLER